MSSVSELGTHEAADLPKSASSAPRRCLQRTHRHSLLQPPIEKFIQRNLGSFEPAAQVAFAQHFRQVFLGAARSAVDRAIVVAPLPGFALAAEEDADEPAVPPASHDLSRLASQRTSLPKIWHTAGTLAPAMDLSDQLLGGEGE